MFFSFSDNSGMTFELKTYTRSFYIIVSENDSSVVAQYWPYRVPSDYSFHARYDFSFSCGLQTLGPLQVGKLISCHHQRVACVSDQS